MPEYGMLIHSSRLPVFLTSTNHLLQFAPMFEQIAAPRRFRRRRLTAWSGV
jgi:hypothetical protein